MNTNTVVIQEVLYICPICQNKGKKVVCSTCGGDGRVNLFELVKYLVTAGNLKRAKNATRVLTPATLLECPACQGKLPNCEACNTCQRTGRCRQVTAVNYLCESNHRAVRV